MMLVIAPIRGQDKHGAGYYGAPRGTHFHRGIDIACYAGSEVLAERDGTVTKIGYPYNPTDPEKGHLRYVEVTDDKGYRARYFYVESYLDVGDEVKEGLPVGKTQGLAEVYPGITDHFHFEVIDPAGEYMNPADYIAEADAHE